MVYRNRWRYDAPKFIYEMCLPHHLGEGYLYTGNSWYKPADVVFSAFCDRGEPVLSSAYKLPFSNLPYIENSWDQYITDYTFGAPFKYSVYPTIISLTVCCVVTVMLTLVVLIHVTHYPSWLLRAGTVLASVNLLYLLGHSFEHLRKNSWGLNGSLVVDLIASDMAYNLMDFFAVLMLELAQVQVIMRLFPRVKEKRVAFLVGTLFSVSSQLMWIIGVATMYWIAGDPVLLPAFTYLLRIALATAYAVLVVVWGFSIKSWQNVKSLTFVSFVVVFLQTGFFVADLANAWVSDLSEIFNTTCYVASTVVVWEWINRVHREERRRQNKSVLGRPVYEQEDVAGVGGSKVVNRVLFFTDQLVHGLQAKSIKSSEKEEPRNPTFIYNTKEVVLKDDNLS